METKVKRRTRFVNTIMSDKLHKPVLVLNKNWIAIDTTPLHRAFSLILSSDSKGKPKASIIDIDCTPYTWQEWTKIKAESEDDEIRTVSLAFKIPQIIRLNKYEKMPKQVVIFSRLNLYKRDGYSCQYCGVRPKSEELTIDHINPRCRGGMTTWENCVVCCTRCNRIKGGRTPGEVRHHDFPGGMKLMKTPVRPKVSDIKFKIFYPSWNAWLNDAYWNVELENDNK